MSQKSIRKSLFGVIKAFTAHQILAIFFLMIIYIELLVLILCKLNLWNFYLLKDTIYWTFGVAFILLANINKTTENNSFFKQTLLSNLKFIVILEFITNLYVFSLVAELIVMPILIFGNYLAGYLSSNKIMFLKGSA